MIAVVQCLNCKALIASWAKRGHWAKENFERVIYHCTDCGHFTMVAVKTTPTIEELMPPVAEKRT